MNSNSTNNLSNKEQISTKNTKRRSANWDIKNAPKNYFSLILTQIGSSFFAFASVWLLTKQIGSEGYGGIVAILAASQIALVLINWTSYAVIKFGTEEFVETERIARIFWTRVFILTLNLILVLLASNLWLPPLAQWLKLSDTSLWMVILHFSISAFWIHIQYSLQGIKMQRLQGGLLTIERFLIFAGLLFLTLTNRIDFYSAVVLYIVSPFLMILTGLGFLRNYIFSKFTVNKKFLREIIVYSIPLLPFSLIGYFSTSYVDAVFITGFLSVKDLGIYSVATQINGLSMQVPTLANSLLIPLFVTLQKENRMNTMNNFFEHTTPTITLLWGFLCSFAALAGWVFIPLIFGEGFVQAILPLWILLTASVLSMPALVGYAALVHASGNTYIATIVAVVTAFVNISANLILIPTYGMKGCAWATVVTYFASVLTFAIILRRKIKIPISWVFVAPIPSLCGAAFFTWSQNPWLAMAVNLIVMIAIIFVKKDSIKEGISISRGLKPQTP